MIKTFPAALVLAALVVTVPSQITSDPDEIHALGVGHHLERSLNEAAAAYDRALALEPPREPTADEWRRIIAFAPRLLAQRDEPFGMTDAAAILHPQTGVIAYHFFWDDDIDFPDDNDPCDHEVAWVRPSEDGRTIDAAWTYFHGRILAAGSDALADARKNGGRIAIYAQWGKHGSMPHGWRTATVATELSEVEEGIAASPANVPMTLADYNKGTWRKLSTTGRRAKDNPIALRARWPERFEGTWEDFQRFTRPIDVAGLLTRKRLALISRWNTGPLNRWLIRYNFRPKEEWPEQR